MQRKIYSLMVWLKASKQIGAIVTPPDNPGGCLRLINSKRDWLTATAGEAVLLTHEEKSKRYFMDSIDLYPVDPSRENGRVVTTAGDWLQGGGAMREFFKDWRRKAGCVLLVMAAIAIGGYVRSHFMWDRLFIRVGSTMHILTSFDGYASYRLRETSPIEVDMTEILPEWKSRTSSEIRSYSPLDEGLHRWVIHYSVIVLILTVLSAYLILWKPRKQKAEFDG